MKSYHQVQGGECSIKSVLYIFLEFDNYYIRVCLYKDKNCLSTSFSLIMDDPSYDQC